MTAPSVTLDPISVTSLFIKMSVNGIDLGSGTAFVVQNDGRDYLITNWHNLAGRNPETGQAMSSTGGLPNEVIILHHDKKALGTFCWKKYSLNDADGRPLWLEHPLGNKIDVVALPIVVPADVMIYPMDLRLAHEDMLVGPAMSVSVIGYPFGMSAGGLHPIWKTGHLASDPDVDFVSGIPAFLIDATTRGGMSGSPVVLRTYGTRLSTNGAVAMNGNGVFTKFLGVYSGRIRDDSELGRVWRPVVIDEILQAKSRPVA